MIAILLSKPEVCHIATFAVKRDMMKVIEDSIEFMGQHKVDKLLF